MKLARILDEARRSEAYQREREALEAGAALEAVRVDLAELERERRARAVGLVLELLTLSICPAYRRLVLAEALLEAALAWYRGRA